METIDFLNRKIHFRKNTSDEKTIKEILNRNLYQKQNFKIEKDDIVLDAGSNIGTFALYSLNKLAKRVYCYEPSPVVYKILELNLSDIRNIEIYNMAIISDNKSEGIVSFFTRDDMQNWRDSLYKHYKKIKTTELKVNSVNFKNAIKDSTFVKIDIEGEEMDLLMNANFEDTNIRKLVFEWTFDVDPSVERFYSCINKLKDSFKKVEYIKIDEKVKEYKFFPPTKMVYCWR